MSHLSIVADGDIAFEHLSNQPILACDGAAQRLVEQGFRPSAVIGDFDTLSRFYASKKDIERHFQGATILHQACQETTDFEKAMLHARTQPLDVVDCFGLFGQAFDHSYYNLMLFQKYAPTLPLTLIHTHHQGTQWGFYIDHPILFEVESKAIFSFLPLKDTQVKTHGLTWDLDTTLSPVGGASIRNRAKGTHVEINSQGVIVLIDQPRRPLWSKKLDDG